MRLIALTFWPERSQYEGIYVYLYVFMCIYVIQMQKTNAQPHFYHVVDTVTPHGYCQEVVRFTIFFHINIHKQ